MAAIATIAIGTELGQTYLVERLIHSAAVEIYDARDQILGLPVSVIAYRLLPVAEGGEGDAHDDRYRLRVRDGLKRLLGVRHPALVTPRAIATADGLDYVVVDRIDGLPLLDWCRREGGLTPPMLDRILDDALGALAAAHAAALVVGVVEPASVWMGADGMIRVLPSVLLSAAAGSMADGAPPGTRLPAYAPPEWSHPEGVRRGPWTDVYGLAALLYEAVGGEAPPQAIERLVEDRLVPLADRLPGNAFDPGVLAAIDAGLALQSTARPQSVADWRRIFAAAQSRAGAAAPAARAEPRLPGADEIVSRASATRVRAGAEADRDAPRTLPVRALSTDGLSRWSDLRAAAAAGRLAIGESEPATPAPAGGILGAPERVPAPVMSERPPEERAAPHTPGSGGGSGGLLAVVAVVAGSALFAAMLLSQAGRDAMQHLLAVLGVKKGGLLALFSRRSRRVQQTADTAGGPVTDLVDCSVFAPPGARAGSSFLVQVFLHRASDAGRVRVSARMMDAAAALRGVKTLAVEIVRGTRVSVALSGAGVEVTDPVETMVWRGEPVFAQFVVEVPKDAAGRRLHLTARISLDGALLGRITFAIDAAAAATVAEPVPAGESAGRYRRAFVSYASADRNAVLARVQMLQATRVSFFQDVLSLDPGERWERALYREIDGCDLFLLFWSEAAKASPWVLKEAEYALARQAASGDEEPDIVPVILEGPPVVLPPPSLAGLHFDDRIRYFMREPA